MPQKQPSPKDMPYTSAPHPTTVILIRAIHERLSSGQFLHLPVHTRGEVEKDLGDSLRVCFVPDPEAEPLRPPTSPLCPRLEGDRVVSIICIVAGNAVRKV